MAITGVMMNETLLIVNPRAGGGRAGIGVEALRQEVEAAIGPVDLVHTEASAHGVELAQAAVTSGYKLVVAAGGDGTVHEVVTGLIDARRAGQFGASDLPALGIIGLGTGGDFTKTLGITHTRAAYIEVLRAGHERTLDVGLFDCVSHEGQPRSRVFMNILSMGISGLADQLVAKASRALGSQFAYLQSSIRALLRSRVGHVHLEITGPDGVVKTLDVKTRLIAVCNGRFFGSGMEVAPMAVPDDGQFEIVIIESEGRLSLLRGMGQIYSGAHMRRKDVLHLPCTKVVMHLQNTDVAERFILDVDGEPLGRLPLTIQVLPHALRVRAPARG